ncbi:MAG: sugar ABC transporter permease [Firmicutes bacterium]|nr:sugar ABC transporter permease [Bacillota bacterium]
MANKKNKVSFAKDMQKNYPVYVMFLPVLAFYLIFHYYPMAGIVMAFKNYKASLGIWASPWTTMHGFKHFYKFFTSAFFWRTIRNTTLLSLYQLIFGFPAPILLALMLTELRSNGFKRVMQTITYLPHFISTVVICGMLIEFCLTDGLFNQIGALFGAEAIPFLSRPQYFRTIYVGSGIWQQIGWNSIIYLAAIAGIDLQLYEAAELDGAGRFRKIWNITLPGIKSTIVVLLIMQIGRIMSIGHDKTLLLQTDGNLQTSEIISTYVYKQGLGANNDFSYSTAVNLFNSVINFTLVILANFISRKVSETSLF